MSRVSCSATPPPRALPTRRTRTGARGARLPSLPAPRWPRTSTTWCTGTPWAPLPTRTARCSTSRSTRYGAHTTHTPRPSTSTQTFAATPPPHPRSFALPGPLGFALGCYRPVTPCASLCSCGTWALASLTTAPRCSSPCLMAVRGAGVGASRPKGSSLRLPLCCCAKARLAVVCPRAAGRLWCRQPHEPAVLP